ncbi:MAG: PD-(D/E)XK nuclease-like domain-containing protein, partial [Dehalococcoidia bacterium]|nr:PD-(D/E)XK nuclease-like domain-containing protein [Dehalococcoidia bacterium]
MTFAEYIDLDAINWSRLRHLWGEDGSPRRYRHALTEPREDNDTLRRGRAVHTAILEPDRFPLDYAVYRGPRRAGKEWDAFEAAHSDRTILTAAQYDTALAIRDAVRRDPIARRYLDGDGSNERTLTWTDERTGFRCKCRLDRFNFKPRAIVDVKTARSIAKRRFANSGGGLGYQCQMGHYTSGAIANGLLVERRAVLIAVEHKRPHDVAVFLPPESEI